MFGSGWLLLLSLLFLALSLFESPRPNPFWAAPLLVVICLWVFSQCFWSFDIQSFRLLWQGMDGPGPSGMRNVLLSSYNSPPFAISAGWAFLRFLTLAALCSFFGTRVEERERFLRGLDGGLGIAAACTIFSLLYPNSLVLPNQSPFWTSIHRAAGTFSDPNAFGIFIILVLPLIYWRARNAQGTRRSYLSTLLVLWSVLGAFSGSRSFFLGLGLYVLWYGACAGRRFFWTILGSLAIVVVALNVAWILDPTSVPSWSAKLPQGLQRVADAMTLSNAKDTFFSRFAFWRIGLSMWLDNFFFGVGFEQFRFHVPEYAARLGLPTGTWTDNSNNFYLGLLAEMGVLGGAAFLCALAALRWKHDAAGIFFRAPLTVLLILLFVGPHLAFDEVSILVAALLSMTCEVHSLRWPRAALVIAPLMGAGIFLKSATLSRGFFMWERDGQTSLRWTGRSAYGRLVCDASGKAHLSIRALNPDVAAQPVLARVLTADQTSKSLELRSAEWQTVQFDCPHLKTIPESALSLGYSLDVNRLWVPAKFGMGDDARLLGVQVRQDQ